jgi:hypothetical protein
MSNTSSNKTNMSNKSDTTYKTTDFFEFMDFEWEHKWRFFDYKVEHTGSLRVTNYFRLGEFSYSCSPINIWQQDKNEVHAFYYYLLDKFPNFPQDKWIPFECFLCIDNKIFDSKEGEIKIVVEKSNHDDDEITVEFRKK